MIRLGCFLAFVISAIASPSTVSPGVSRFLEPISLDGSIRVKGAENAAPVFTFHRRARAVGAKVSVSRDFFTSERNLAARESVEYEGNDLKRVNLDELQIQAKGSATFERTSEGKTRIYFEYCPYGKPKRAAAEIQAGSVLVSDTLPDFIREHWDALDRGESFDFRYAVIPRLETVGFRLRKIDKAIDQESAEIEMRPSSWFLRTLVEPVVFTVESKPPHRILRYTGRTTPKLRRGNDWEDFEAITVFDW